MEGDARMVNNRGDIWDLAALLDGVWEANELRMEIAVRVSSLSAE
jgi:hypothetical protein